MSFKSSAGKTAIVFSLLAVGFGVSAKQISFSEYVDYTMMQHFQQVQFDVQSEIAQSVHDNAYASLKSDALLPSVRPVVNIIEIEPTEEDEEE